MISLVLLCSKASSKKILGCALGSFQFPLFSFVKNHNSKYAAKGLKDNTVIQWKATYQAFSLRSLQKLQFPQSIRRLFQSWASHRKFIITYQDAGLLL